MEAMPTARTATAAAVVPKQKTGELGDVSCKHAREHKHKHEAAGWRRRTQDEAFRREPEGGPLGGTRSQGPGPETRAWGKNPEGSCSNDERVLFGVE